MTFKATLTLTLFLATMNLSSASERDLSYLPEIARKLILKLDMQNIPHEGPWFLQTYKSDEVIEGPSMTRYKGERFAYTAIYGLITEVDFSALHKLNTDEMWHFYAGSPLELFLIYPEGHSETIIMGPDILNGQSPQFLVPRNTWMAAKTTGTGEEAWSLGCNTLSPGFEYADYTPGYRNELIEMFPELSDKITEFTREDSLKAPEGSETAKQPEAISVAELIGRSSTGSTDMSVARFTIQPLSASPSMSLKSASEIILVTKGSGSAKIGEATHELKPGSALQFPQGVPHSVIASDSGLEFYAICSPAYDPNDVTYH